MGGEDKQAAMGGSTLCTEAFVGEDSSGSRSLLGSTSGQRHGCCGCCSCGCLGGNPSSLRICWGDLRRLNASGVDGAARQEDDISVPRVSELKGLGSVSLLELAVTACGSSIRVSPREASVDDPVVEEDCARRQANAKRDVMVIGP